MTRRFYGISWSALVGFLMVSASGGLSQPPGGGKGGFGPPGGQQRKILDKYDANKDGWLNKEERAQARESLQNGGGFKGFGGKGFGKGGEPGRPGPKVLPAEVKNYPEAKLYEPTVLRTIFLEFENKDWEQELQDFHGTDVDVPATMIVDGKRYANVGVHFRGMSSYMGVPAGSKRSFNVSLDLADPKQRLLGSKTLNLLNGHEDPSMLGTVLYSHIARQYIAAPNANVVKVVINGESWGLYMNVQQFDKVFLNENFQSTKGTRWKVRGNPGARGGLEYWGDDIESYKRVFDMKSNGDDKAWKALVNLCKVLDRTPADKLEATLAPILDLDGLLWFLALDVALVNNDGYWTRASDYSLFLDEKGKFHIIPSDMNEALGIGMGGPGGGGFMMRPKPGEILPPPLIDQLRLTEDQKKKFVDLQKETDERLANLLTPEQRDELKRMQQGPPPGGFGPSGGPPGGPPGGFGPPSGGGMGMGPRGGGVLLDPLVGLDNNPRMPLRSKVLAVPALRARYLEHLNKIS
jgi:hypothetical protein